MKKQLSFQVDMAKGVGNQLAHKLQLCSLKEKQIQANAEQQAAINAYKRQNLEDARSAMAKADIEISACRMEEFEAILASAQKAKLTKENKKVNLTIVKKLPESVAEMHKFAVYFDKKREDESLQKMAMTPYSDFSEILEFLFLTSFAGVCNQNINCSRRHGPVGLLVTVAYELPLYKLDGIRVVHLPVSFPFQ